MKVLKVVLLLLATTIMGIVIYFIQAASIVDVMASTYVVIVSSFLGTDIAAMIKDTSKKPAGEWKNIKAYRYVLSFLCMSSLFVMALYQKEINNVDSIMAISSFGSGAMLIIGLVMAGLEGNKIASRIGS